MSLTLKAGDDPTPTKQLYHPFRWDFLKHLRYSGKAQHPFSTRILWKPRVFVWIYCYFMWCYTPIVGLKNSISQTIFGHW